MPAPRQTEKQQRLAEIQAQLQQTGKSVKQGKQLLGALAENYGNMAPPTYLDPNPSPWPQQQMPPPNADTSPGSPARILTTSPSARRSLLFFI